MDSRPGLRDLGPEEDPEAPGPCRSALRYALWPYCPLWDGARRSHPLLSMGPREEGVGAQGHGASPDPITQRPTPPRDPGRWGRGSHRDLRFPDNLTYRRTSSSLEDLRAG